MTEGDKQGFRQLSHLPVSDRLRTNTSLYSFYPQRCQHLASTVPNTPSTLLAKSLPIKLIDNPARSRHNLHGPGRVRVAAQRDVVLSNGQLQLLAADGRDGAALDLASYVLFRVRWVPRPVDDGGG
jgi:hypothetical protein